MKSSLIKKEITLIGIITIIVFCLPLGCAARKSFNVGEQASGLGQWDEAIKCYSRAVELAPQKPRYKIALERSKLAAAQQYFKRGMEYANSN